MSNVAVMAMAIRPFSDKRRRADPGVLVHAASAVAAPVTEINVCQTTYQEFRKMYADACAMLGDKTQRTAVANACTRDWTFSAARSSCAEHTTPNMLTTVSTAGTAVDVTLVVDPASSLAAVVLEVASAIPVRVPRSADDVGAVLPAVTKPFEIVFATELATDVRMPPSAPVTTLVVEDAAGVMPSVEDLATLVALVTRSLLEDLVVRAVSHSALVILCSAMLSNANPSSPNLP